MKCIGPYIAQLDEVKISRFQDLGSFHTTLNYLSDRWPVGAVIGQGPPVWTRKILEPPEHNGTIIVCL